MKLFKKAQDLFRRGNGVHGLGFIPDWQFSANPHVNPMVNPTVSMPAGMFQAGVMTAQSPYGGQTAFGPVSGLAGTELKCLNCAGVGATTFSQLVSGRARAKRAGLATVLKGNGLGLPVAEQYQPPGFGYVMIDEGPGGLGFIESFWWQHRRAVVLTVLGVGAAALLGVGAMLK